MIERDIVVVGAGPVGLTAALAVRALGRPVTLVEAGAADRVGPASRAIFLHKVTVEVLERIRLGLGYELARHGLAWVTKRTLYRGREVYRWTYPPAPPGVLPAATSLPQVVTERVLLEASIDAGVEFIWSTQVTGANADARGVLLVTGHGAPVTARYVIGADGSRSAVRESAGLSLRAHISLRAPRGRVPQRALRSIRGALAGRSPVSRARRSGRLQQRRWPARVDRHGDAGQIHRSRDLGLDVRVSTGDCQPVCRPDAPGPARG